jgi:hypothetical protein
VFAGLAVLSLSLAFEWGSAAASSGSARPRSSGRAGYTYAVAAINLGDTTGAIDDAGLVAEFLGMSRGIP